MKANCKGYMGLILVLVLALALVLLLGFFELALGKELPRTLDIADNDQNVIIFGAEAGDFLTDFNSLAACDFNGDGFKDIIIGAPTADGPKNSRPNAGEVYIIFGGPMLPESLDLGIAGADVTVKGADPGDSLGASVTCGDINADSIEDIILGAPLADGADNRLRDAGDVYIIFGNRRPDAIYDLADRDQDTTIFGGGAGDNLGAALAAGDVNGDGIADLILGAPNADGPRNERANAGEVYIFFGSLSPGTMDLAKIKADVTVFGANDADFSGGVVTSSDVNGDGIDDLIIGATGADGPGNERTDSGEVYVLFGKTTWPAALDIALKNQDVTIFADGAGNNLGSSIACGDVNNDGIADLIIGAPEADGPRNIRTNAGEAYVIFGGALLPVIDIAKGAQNMTIFGAEADDSLGLAVASSDLNNDGISDIILGASTAGGPENNRRRAGEAYIIFGSTHPPTVIDIAGNNNSYNVIVLGAQIDDRLGRSLATGDLDGDGSFDLILGAPNADGPENRRRDAGEAYIILGSTFMPPDISPPQFSDFSPAPGAKIEDRQPQISVEITDDRSGVNPATIQMTITDSQGKLHIFDRNRPGAHWDGKTFSVDLTAAGITLPDGKVTVKVSAADFATNKGETSWTFTVSIIVERLKGDVNGDGKVDLTDAQLVAKFIVGLIEFTELQKWAADVIEPCGTIDVTDTRWIGEYANAVPNREMNCLSPSPLAERHKLSSKEKEGVHVYTFARVHGNIEFRVLGLVEMMQVEIYNLAGRKIFASGEIFANTLQWHLQNNLGEVVANGVYLYIVTARGFDGKLVRSEVKELVVLR